MRYAAFSAAVFSGAMFLVSSSHAPTAGAPSSSTLSPTPAVMQVLSSRTSQTAVRVSDGVARSTRSAAAPTAKAAVAAVSVAPAPQIVVVASGDSLAQIARDHGTDTQRLYAANATVDDPNVIYPGQQLRIPTADEQLADRPLPVPSAAPAIADGSVWDQLAQCESGGNWAINTGNGFYGGLQFTLASWQAVGGTGMPNQASREEQILRGQILQQRGGWGNWPACTAKLGIQ